MNTPIYDFVRQYIDSGFGRLHMPGHKGKCLLGCEALDITEIAGADDLYEPNGIIAASERNASALFGSSATLYSTEGSSQCIRAMLQLAVQNRRVPGQKPLILAGRNAHKSFLYACALLGIQAEWLWPEDTSGLLWNCPVSPQGLLQRLNSMPRTPDAVYITSPDYLGQLADISALAKICHARNIPLLVDNAHGAYLHFLETPCHPLDLGADLCCDSAHKTLPALTGSAYLHLGSGASALQEQARQALALFGSTSPSYLILQSLDLVNQVLSDRLPAQLQTLAGDLALRRESLTRAGVQLLPGEPLKLTVHTAAMGLTGIQAADYLRRQNLEPEFADRDCLVCMLSPGNSQAELDRLEQALLSLPKGSPLTLQERRFIPLTAAMSIRDACLAPSEELPLDKAAGRICAAPAVSCPPAVALAVSGEILTAEALALFRQCGIDSVRVVKQ